MSDLTPEKLAELRRLAEACPMPDSDPDTLITVDAPDLRALIAEVLTLREQRGTAVRTMTSEANRWAAAAKSPDEPASVTNRAAAKAVAILWCVRLVGVTEEADR